ncbi:glutamine synthetase [Saccharopolyspora erythraea NRRL 2338]|uniref:Glutamine synthetase n=2 Tax=Saccharopolyspora erythraea TaxID=1836 RepID=A4FKL8_SACEN|nr:glutamine synthetase family protein [Saccharopolyspora erythraea]EQD83088.1 glutamate--ammonia ligase [Saccharopolyspora erythraea D]PFG98231.1 glutamine synthetase [Saccharopolyspora erythraea NRRL 2338]QRK88328.1 glutamine synthetase [Saccharopolyspora erythraea]CAM04593.1 putative glutamine synthetase [Saccharopolyspora erythraea NRRL 2338]
MGPSDQPLAVEELRGLVESGAVDTVVVAMTDMQGRLQGKRCSGRYFLEQVLDHGTEACNYLLAVDVDMTTVDGYAMTSWETGYGDFVLRPDLATLRLVPWQEATALVLCDVLWHSGEPVAPSPRQVLRGQLDRLAELGLTAHVGTELEFLVFRDSYEQAWDKRYEGLTPANQYNVDYSVAGTGRIERLLRRIRNDMGGAGLYVESAKGECNLGQHEIAIRYSDALTSCDNHALYKNGAKEIAAQEGLSLSFMAKFDAREGNSSHIHVSLRDAGGPVLPGDGPHGFSPLMEHFIAGQLACLPELTYFFAPNINSYKRFAKGSFAPTAVAWGRDNRTCALRVVGHGDGLRVENRVPGGDINPYLAVAATLAAGLHGIAERLPLEPMLEGNAYAAQKESVPTTLRDAARLLADSKVAAEAFGPEVVEHYVNAARVELDAFDTAVTDWERIRGFERL